MSIVINVYVSEVNKATRCARIIECFQETPTRHCVSTLREEETSHREPYMITSNCMVQIPNVFCEKLKRKHTNISGLIVLVT